jgi:hypothetical protein
LAEVKDEIGLVKKHNVWLKSMKMVSPKKVTGIYTRILERFQQAFPWLKPRLISYYKARKKKKSETKLSAKKEKELTSSRAALTKKR